MMAFINGLDTFPRLFVIQKFVLAYGDRSPARPRAASSTSGSSAARVPVQLRAVARRSGPVATPTPATAGPYSLSITGSIYYTSTPNALDACTKATATLK